MKYTRVENIIGTIWLFLFYFIEGLVIGYYRDSLQVLLIEKGATYEELSVLSLTMIPFSLKFLSAPIIDKYYDTDFGKRKSWIVPSYILLSLFFFLSAMYMDNLINNTDVGKIIILNLIIVWILAMADIAVDGWLVTMLDCSFC